MPDLRDELLPAELTYTPSPSIRRSAESRYARYLARQHRPVMWSVNICADSGLLTRDRIVPFPLAELFHQLFFNNSANCVPVETPPAQRRRPAATRFEGRRRRHSLCHNATATVAPHCGRCGVRNGVRRARSTSARSAAARGLSGEPRHLHQITSRSRRNRDCGSAVRTAQSRRVRRRYGSGRPAPDAACGDARSFGRR